MQKLKKINIRKINIIRFKISDALYTSPPSTDFHIGKIFFKEYLITIVKIQYSNEQVILIIAIATERFQSEADNLFIIFLVIF
ncbi:hypothetical protein HX13_22630 [Chryseobacterium sp. P1-3]|uniref:hypothetical protein n=1 Tax=Chryseobacterium sp. (strain P1-3) TaxID=1517683 RepID=UPI0004E75E87|nr:hypothetical protein [Chryseobacterium sp. P1-3]KFF73150.1 hypothetical protein HX13_22630 [Chryseobacterium sp. P1-3]